MHQQCSLPPGLPCGRTWIFRVTLVLQWNIVGCPRKDVIAFLHHGLKKMLVWFPALVISCWWPRFTFTGQICRFWCSPSFGWRSWGGRGGIWSVLMEVSRTLQALDANTWAAQESWVSMITTPRLQGCGNAKVTSSIRCWEKVQFPTYNSSVFCFLTRLALPTEGCLSSTWTNGTRLRSRKISKPGNFAAADPGFELLLASDSRKTFTRT